MRRLGAVAGLVAAALLGVGMPAAAADRASLTGVKSEGESVTGVLTVRAPVPLSDVRLRADVGGERRPVEISDEVRVQRTVMLVIDTSGSMGESGMATVRSAVRTFLRSAPTDVEVGVASFAATSGVDLQPTTRKRQVLRNVDGLTSDGDTDLFGGVTKATKELARYDGDRSIVLLSDGADTIAANPRAALGRASRTVRRNDVRLDVVRFNTDDPAAVRSLARLARAGDGGVVAAGNGRAVARAFGAAAGALESQVSFTVQLDRPLAGRAPVVLTGTAPGVDFVARGTARPGELGSSAGEEATPGTAAEEASGTEQLVVDRTGWYRVPAFGAAALALALFLAGVAYLLPRKTRREQRVEAIEGYLPWAAPTAGPSKAQPSAVTAKVVAVGEQVAQGRRSTTRTMALIRRADLRFTAGEWLVIRAIVFVLGTAVAFALWRSWVLTLVAAVVALAGPVLWLRFVASRRAAKFERQLPDVLFLMATSLSSGFGLSQSIEAVIRDAPDPVATELGRAQAETRLGTELPDALERVAHRMDSTTMSWTVMAMRIQSEVGGNLAETLRTTAQTLRERESLHRQVRALSAEGRLSAYILIALPILLFLYVYAVNRDYISLLWTNPIGIFLSVATVALMAIGVAWMRKVVQVEV